MKKLAQLSIALVAVFLSIHSYAATYYVSFINGSDTYNGSISTPYKTITKAVSVAVAGDIIYLRGETHTYTSKISISKSGTAVNRISLLAYPGDAARPILNFSGMAVSTSNRGIELSGNYWVFKGFDIYKAGDNGMHLSGGYNIIEFCAFYENADTGLQLANGGHDNQIINCDSYYNIDVATGEGNADGYAAKLDVGTGNSFKGCRAWQNSDDGWDGLLTTGLGTNPATTYDSCWCFLNGYRKDMTASLGNGNGFKMGGNNEKHDATLRNCLSFHNRVKGFDQNNNNGSMILYNCTGYRNNPNFGMNSNDPSAGEIAEVKNCISYSNRSASDAFRAVVTRVTNSWQITGHTTPAASDFQSLDTSVLRGPRNADGSLPAINLLKLTSTSPYVNAGTNVGLPYYGSAPDLGYAESYYPFPVGMTSFEAVVNNNNVTLNWKTATETNNKGWEVERYIVATNSIAWQKIGFVAGKGTSNTTNAYSYNDNNLAAGSIIQYRLKQVDVDGNFRYTNILTIKIGGQQKTDLGNYPNPFRSSTTLRFTTAEKGNISLAVYNAAGQLVKTVLNENMDAGVHMQILDAKTFAPGQYFVKLVTSSESLTAQLFKAE
jgi:hypothetical protein